MNLSLVPSVLANRGAGRSTEALPPAGLESAGETRLSGSTHIAAVRPFAAGASLASLRELYHLRSIAIAGQAFAVGIAYATDLALEYVPMLIVLFALAAFNVVLGRRVHHGLPGSHLEVFGNVVADLGAFTTILLLSGGTSNPFALLYLLQVALIAVLLPARFAALGTCVALVGFALAAEFAFPLKLLDGRDISPTLLTAGRYVSFGLTALMIAWFVSRVSTALNTQQVLLEDAARKAVNDEALLSIGTIATGAAHELGSPLMTMTLIVQEWQRQGRPDDFKRDVGILSSQIAACKDALANLRAAAKGARLDDGAAQPLDRLMQELAERCRATRPGVDIRCDLDGTTPPPAIQSDAALKQAILILLNNAADACPTDVQVSVRWSSNEVQINVADRGPGIPAARLADLGRIFFTTKAPGKGNGLGVMLAAATVARLGGSISWCNRDEGGAIARVRVPLSSLQHFS